MTTNKKIMVFTFIVVIILLFFLFDYYVVNKPKTDPISFHHTLIIEPDDGRDNLINVLSSAKKSIDLIIYEFGDPQINQEIANAKSRGVSIRILYNSFHNYGHKSILASEADFLETNNISARPANTFFKNTHQKTFVVDSSTAIIMTFNLLSGHGSDYFGKTRDFAIITNDSSEVNEIQSVFNDDWEHAEINGVYEHKYNIGSTSLVWSPDNSRERITELILSAKSSLDIYNEEVEDKDILDAIKSVSLRGVKVRFLCPILGSRKKDHNQKGSIELSTSGISISEVPSKSKILYMHAKMILADPGTDNAKAYLGSENFSKYSLDKNRELGIIISDKEILTKLKNTFDQDWDNYNSFGVNDSTE